MSGFFFTQTMIFFQHQVRVPLLVLYTGYNWCLPDGNNLDYVTGKWYRLHRFRGASGCLMTKDISD